MAEIALRDYLTEIDTLIEGNSYDEAIAHCRHILGAYPKCLEVYRLLGKATLEKEDDNAAIDLFQRVLSADPVLRYAEELVSRMRIVRRRGNTTLGEGAAVDEAYPFVVMPRTLWRKRKSFRRAMKRLAGDEVGLIIKEQPRYDLPRSQVCLRIVRK